MTGNCPECGKHLGPTNKHGYCKIHRKKSPGYRETIRASHQLWWQSLNGRKRTVTVNIMHRAELNSVPYDLTVVDYLFSLLPADVLETGFQAECGHHVKFYGGHGSGTRSDAASVDRIVPRSGYVMGNVQWLCVGCNVRKRGATNRRS